LFGERADLVEVRKDAGGLHIEGLVAALGDQGPTRGAQNVFVNRRIVKDRTIAHAIIEAYSVATIKERSPEVHLFLRIAPDRVDVNVHPTKAEVRFLEGSLVHQVLRRALGEALGQGRRRAAVPARTGSPRPGDRADDAFPACSPAPRSAIAGRTSSCRFQLPAPGFRLQFPTPIPIRDPRSDPENPADDSARAVPRHVHHRGGRRGVAIIDQHVAHERVLFEQVMERLTAGRMESQRLLTPILLELSPAQRDALSSTRRRSSASAWSSRSSAATASGCRRCRRCSIRPSAMPRYAPWPRISKGSPAAAASRTRSARSRRRLACHAAVKANYPLTLDKMRYILEELRRTAYSASARTAVPSCCASRGARSRKNFQRI
jgi:DNA mismatch repair protein MutL